MISVVIPVYKNKKMLVDNLNKNVQFLKNTEVIIINDSPEIDLKKDLTKFNISLIENEKNLGFGPSVNKGVMKASNKYVLLLNSDVKLKNSNFLKSIKYFEENKKLFAVSFAQKERNNLVVGKNKIYWKCGFFRHKKDRNLSFGISSWIEGGACIVNRDLFLKFGGFDDLYSPFYWEDVDLSYRVWKSGYEIFFDPNILVEHNHESTISKFFSKDYIQEIAYRNQLIFIWKNITDFKYFLTHTLFLISDLFRFIVQKKVNFLKGFLSALKKGREIFIKKNKQKTMYVFKDSEILSKFV